MSYAWIVILVIVVFVAYQFIKWYSSGGKKQLDDVIKSFNKQKEKILNNDTSSTTIPNSNI